MITKWEKSYLIALLLSLIIQLGGVTYLSLKPKEDTSRTMVSMPITLKEVMLQTDVQQSKKPTEKSTEKKLNKRQDAIDQSVADVPRQQTDTSNQGPAYLKALASLIQQEIQYPLISQRKGERGSVEVSFQLHPDNTISSITIIASSRFSRLDHEVIRAIEEIKSNSLPSPPENLFPAGPITIKQKFHFY